MRRPIKSSLAGLMGFAAAALAGCGQSDSPSPSSSAANASGVIASAADCSSFGPETVKACATAIEAAVKRHETSTTSHTNQQLCEAAVGPGKCERTASGHYRARLSAFMVKINGTTAQAEPLYPVTDGGVGFQTASKNKFLASDSSVAFSSLARSVAEMQSTGKGRRKQKL